MPWITYHHSLLLTVILIIQKHYSEMQNEQCCSGDTDAGGIIHLTSSVHRSRHTTLTLRLSSGGTNSSPYSELEFANTEIIRDYRLIIISTLAYTERLKLNRTIRAITLDSDIKALVVYRGIPVLIVLTKGVHLKSYCSCIYRGTCPTRTL